MNVRDNKARHRFETLVGDDEFAFAEYSIEGDAITFPHTVVPEAYEGQGVGKALVEAALASARQRGLKVRPHCAFFAHYMRQHPETQDLLAPGEADRLAASKDD